MIHPSDCRQHEYIPQVMPSIFFGYDSTGVTYVEQVCRHCGVKENDVKSANIFFIMLFSFYLLLLFGTVVGLFIFNI